VTSSAQMKAKLLERSAESQRHFEAFAQTDLYRRQFGTDMNLRGREFHDAYDAFVERYWTGGETLTEIGWVHDAITRNYFLDGSSLTVIDVGGDYVGSVGHVISTMSTQLLPRSTPWSFAEYKALVDELLRSYEGRLGRTLTDAQQTEIIQHLAHQPYKMLSSDSERLLLDLRKACGLPSSAGEAELLAGLRQPENLGAIEGFLLDPAARVKLDRHMLMIEHSLMLLEERLPNTATGHRQALSRLLDQVREARRTGIRVTTFDRGRLFHAAGLG